MRGRPAAEAPVVAPVARPGTRTPRGRYVDSVEVCRLVVHLARIVQSACDRHDGCGAAIRVLSAEGVVECVGTCGMFSDGSGMEGNRRPSSAPSPSSASAASIRRASRAPEVLDDEPRS